MEYFVFFSALIAFGAADISLKNSPPYHPSGWRPSGPVPGEYGAPPAPASLQVSQENLRFIGQLVEVTAGAEPKNAYLPPAASPTAAYHQFGQLNAAQQQQPSDDFFRVQNVPRKAPPRPFRFKAAFRAPQSAPIRDGRRPFQGTTPFFPPSSLTQQPALFAQQQHLPLTDASADPNNQYGPPTPAVQFPPEPEVETETETEEETTDDAPTEDPVIAIANAGNNGQYYILTKDNTLQRVVYTTGQTEDDLLHDGFTAQLRYEPVEPIRDPVYAYDSQGQLIRIYNKK